MNWMNSRKGSWACFAGVAFTIIVLFLTSSCSVPTPTNPLAPTDTPVPVTTVVSAPTDTPTMTSPPTATDTPALTYPAPVLENPAPGATIIGEKLTDFSWQWDGTLQKGQNFDLQIWRSGEPCCSVAILDENSVMWDEDKKCSYPLDTPPGGFGHYLWRVAIVRIDEGGSKSPPLCESVIGSFDWIDVTPTPTFTATPIPTPKPDAVVNVEALNLRSGPGVVYDVLGLLKRGDHLKITGRSFTGDWLKVIAPDGQEGWTACSLLQVNVDMDGVAVAQAPPTPTPMYTPTPVVTPTPELLSAPTLLEPKNGEGDFTGSVVLKWQWERPLKQDEYFSLRVRNDKAGDCHHSQVHEPAYVGGLSYCPSGEYYWQVAVVRRLCEECPNEQMWQPLSHPSEQWLFRYQAVELDEPWEAPEPPKPEPEPPCDKPPC
jgi:hypothetical protein